MNKILDEMEQKRRKAAGNYPKKKVWKKHFISTKKCSKKIQEVTDLPNVLCNLIGEIRGKSVETVLTEKYVKSPWIYYSD